MLSVWYVLVSLQFGLVILLFGLVILLFGLVILLFGLVILHFGQFWFNLQFGLLFLQVHLEVQLHFGSYLANYAPSNSLTTKH